MPPTCAARWVIIRKLDEGGQSITLMVGRKSDQLQAVLKLPKARLNKVALERLRREVRILAEIDHPSIVRLLDSDLQGDVPWFVTPLGIPLDDHWLARRGNAQPSELVDESITVVMSLLDGLAQFHQRGGVHRDIKPGNVIMQPTGDGGSPRAVLIDFGVALRPEDSRLTEVDGRAVANKFAAPPESFYGAVDAPRASWDCLGMAWLWGWLLAAGKKPKYDRYHWRFHEFVTDPRCERVRSVIAACSHELTAPADAGAMLRLLGELRLVPDGAARAPELGSFEDAVAERTATLSRRLSERAQHLEAADVAAAIVAPLYEEVRVRLRRLADEAVTSGLPIQVNKYNTSSTDPNAAVGDVLMQAAHHEAGIEPCIFSITAGTDYRKQFYIYLACRYEARSDDFLPFSIRLSLRHDMGEFPARDVDYLHTRNGGLWADHGRERVDVDHVVDHARAWLRDRVHWSHT